MPLPAGLNGDRQEIFAGKAEADNSMGDRITYPVGSNEIDRVELPQIEGLVIVARREIGLSPVVEVSNVMNCHQIPVDRRVGRLGVFRCPIAVLAWRNCRPPRNEQQETGREDEERAPSSSGEEVPNQQANAKQSEECGENRAQPIARQVGIVDGESAPTGHRCHDNAYQQDDYSAGNPFHDSFLAESSSWNNQFCGTVLKRALALAAGINMGGF